MRARQSCPTTIDLMWWTPTARPYWETYDVDHTAWSVVWDMSGVAYHCSRDMELVEAQVSNELHGGRGR